MLQAIGEDGGRKAVVRVLLQGNRLIKRLERN
jgi:hypothetical protein